MSNRNMNLDVIVRMKDMLSSPLRRLTASLKSLAGFARGIGIVGTAIAAISFLGPINEAAAFQQKLLDIAGTAGLSGDAAFAFVDQAKKQYQSLALEIGQYSDTIATGAGQMIAAGISQDLVDASLKTIGRAAKASNADFNDMAGVATAMLGTLKLPANELEDALAGLVVAGKEGAFELKDMAQYFPKLTSQMAKLGVTGRDAANQLATMLQIARKGTSDPAEAANNLNNFLTKITSPETVKRFKEMNVDIMAVMQDAVVKGISPIEAVIQKISKLTGVSGGEIEGMMKKATANGLTGADALEDVRKQLEAIHGAGTLGELFTDQQVTGFLIPMLANIDEYKRIKEKVAKATGAMTDADFETQMRSLNTQLIIFKEVGRQAMDEVGLAFGKWLPMINDNLSAALLWLRELDASTGGMVRQWLSFAGAGVLVAAGLGALGIVLPIIGAGFSALFALLGPVGLLLAGIGYGAYQIYKNWETVGPRLSRLWDRTKRGFFDFADGMKERGKRIMETGREIFMRYAPMVRSGFASAWGSAKQVAQDGYQYLRDLTPRVLSAGQEMVDRYGPVIRQGFATAWEDVKAGGREVQSFFEGFAKGLDLKIDLSGLTIEDVKVRAFQDIDAALKGIKIGWDALTAFGAGMKPYVFNMGADLGKTANSIGGIATGLERLVNSLTKMDDVDDKKLDGFFRTLGDLTGGSLGLSAWLLQWLAGAIESTVNALADLAKWSGLKISWTDLLPGNVLVNSLEKLVELLGKAKKLLDALGTYKEGDVLPNGTTAGSSADGTDRQAAMDDWLKGPPQVPANSNMLPPVAAAPQEVKANLTVTVKAAGQGTVTSVTSDNKSVPVTTSTGRVIGRN